MSLPRSGPDPALWACVLDFCPGATQIFAGRSASGQETGRIFTAEPLLELFIASIPSLVTRARWARCGSRSGASADLHLPGSVALEAGVFRKVGWATGCILSPTGVTVIRRGEQGSHFGLLDPAFVDRAGSMEDLWLRRCVHRGIVLLHRGVYRSAVEAPVVVAIPDTVSEDLKVHKANTWCVVCGHDAPRGISPGR